MPLSPPGVAFCIVLASIVGSAVCDTLPPADVLPPNLALLDVLVVARLVAGMVHVYQATRDGGTAKIVHGEVGAPLVLVFEPAKPLAFPRLAVACELQEHGLAVL